MRMHGISRADCVWRKKGFEKSGDAIEYVVNELIKKLEEEKKIWQLVNIIGTSILTNQLAPFKKKLVVVWRRPSSYGCTREVDDEA